MHFTTRWHTLAALVLGLTMAEVAPAQPAGSMSEKPNAGPEQQYTILIFERPEALASRSEARKAESYWNGYNTFAAELAKAGALRGGSALDERVAITLRGSGSADRGVSGARLGGYFVIAAATRADAERLARLAPPEAIAVELRQHRDNPTMRPAPNR